MIRSMEISSPDAVKLLHLLNSTDSFPDVKAELQNTVQLYAVDHLRDHGIYAGWASMTGALNVTLTSKYKDGVKCRECRQFGEALYPEQDWSER